MEDPGTCEDPEVEQRSAETGASRCVQEANQNEGNDVLKVVQVTSENDNVNEDTGSIFSKTFDSNPFEYARR